jgi:peptidoglycan/LPS O-acetylase OafA/YrhL
MRERWLPVGVLAGVLFAINVVTRLVVRFGVDDGPAKGNVEGTASLVMFALIGAVLAVVAFVQCRRYPVGRWLGDLLAAAGVAMLLTILIGPFISGGTPFRAGAGDFFLQIWLYAGFAGGGLLIGYLIATALGLDYRSQGLKRYAESKLAKPRRVVRR